MTGRGDLSSYQTVRASGWYSLYSLDWTTGLHFLQFIMSSIKGVATQGECSLNNAGIIGLFNHAVVIQPTIGY